MDAEPKVPAPTGNPKPQAPPAAPRRQVPQAQPVPSNIPSRPHPANTEETWRQQRNTPKTAPTGQVHGKNDVETQDASKATKPTSGYHFTSIVQEMVDGDAIQRTILETMITLPLKEILGISPELQKRFAGLTKTRREYTSKPVEATMQDDLSPREHLGHQGIDKPSSERDPFTNSELLLSYDEDEDVDDILLRYSSAVKIHTNPLFAMTTGRFEGSIAGQQVVFMIDTGSELNLIADDLYRQTNLALDVAGSCWSLNRINGGADDCS